MAAWVQAIGSVIAIWVAIWQSRAQHQSALAVHAAEHRYALVELTKTLAALATNGAKAVALLSSELGDRSAVHAIAAGEKCLDLGDIHRIDGALHNIPLHSLPSSLVTPTIEVCATTRQFLGRVEMALRDHRQMDTAAFDDFFRVLSEINDSLKATCKIIEGQVARVQVRS